MNEAPLPFIVQICTLSLYKSYLIIEKANDDGCKTVKNGLEVAPQVPMEIPINNDDFSVSLELSTNALRFRIAEP